MKSKTRLHSAVFQLTPTRTRYTLVITAKGETTEKISSGLLGPFLAHLKEARDQFGRGGYSIVLQPNTHTDALWFTKATLVRFVRFVNTPEVLERVNMTESEMLQIEEAIAIQNSETLGSNNVEDYRERSLDLIEGSLPIFNVDAENTIAFYQLGSHFINSNGSTSRQNSKVHFLRVLETRKAVLRKEQGMAFARAIAAGFDMDRMAHLLSFAECFGALRLMDACLGFMLLWKGKQETDQWSEIETTEAMTNQAEVTPVNDYDIMRIHETEQPAEFKEACSDFDGKFVMEGKEKASNAATADIYNRDNHEEFRQSWHGMPYHPNHLGGGTSFQLHYPVIEDPQFSNTGSISIEGNLMDCKDKNCAAETWDTHVSYERSQYGSELVKQNSKSQNLRRKADQSGRKKSGVFVIPNINFISSERRHMRTNSGLEFTSEPEHGKEAEDLEKVGPKCKQNKSSGPTKNKTCHKRPVKKNSHSNNDTVYGSEASSGNWHIFQNILLQNHNKDRHETNQGLFAQENELKVMRKQNETRAGPIVSHGRDSCEIKEGRGNINHTNCGKKALLWSASCDELVSHYGKFGTNDFPVDVNSAELIGERGGNEKVVNNASIFSEPKTMSDYHISNSGSVAEYGNRFANRNQSKNSVSNVTDESFIVPVRLSSQDQCKADCRAVNMEGELPSGIQKTENLSSRVGSQLNYEPDALSLMPIWGRVSETIGYNPAVDYEVQVCARSNVTMQQRIKEESESGAEVMSKKNFASRVIDDNAVKRKSGKLSKLTPSTEAQTRAERTRFFKADIEKLKKIKEEEEIKRLEALRRERQMRITARSISGPAQLTLSSQMRPHLKPKVSSVSYKRSDFSNLGPGQSSPVQSLPNRTASLGSSVSLTITRPSNLNKAGPSQSTVSSQVRPHLQTKLSPSYKGSKFNDSEPGPSSPLQRLRCRAASLRSNASAKITRPSGFNSFDQHASNNSIRPVSSLLGHKDSALAIPEKVSVSRIRRQSDPKISNIDQFSSTKLDKADFRESKVGAAGISKLSQPERSSRHHVPSIKSHNQLLLSNSKLTDGHGVQKISAIDSKTRSKVAVPSEKKNTTSECPSDILPNKTRELILKTNGSSSIATEAAEVQESNTNTSHHRKGEEKRVIETTVVLENEPLIPVMQVSAERIDSRNELCSEFKVVEDTGLVTKSADIQAQVSPVSLKEIGGPIKSHVEEELHSDKVATDCIVKELPKTSSVDASSKLCQTPCAGGSSLEDPCTPNLEYTRVPPSCSEMEARTVKIARAHASNFTDFRLSEITPGSIIKRNIKVSTKSIRRVLRFGRVAGKDNVGSDRLINKSSLANKCVASTAFSNEGKKLEQRDFRRSSMSHLLYIA